MSTKPTVISLYTGAGGLDYGFEAAGFRTSVAVEMNRDACITLRHNRPRMAVIEDDIHNVTSDKILSDANLVRGQADVLIGGPPCQPFSKSAYWASGDAARLSDPRSGTLGAYMRVVEDTLPKAFLLENVGAMKFDGKNEGVELLLSLVDDINRRCGVKYAPEFRVLKAADFGVPQLRERFFLVAQRDGQPFTFPTPTHAPLDSNTGQLPFMHEPYRTAWDALHDVRPDEDELAALAPRGKWAELLPSIEEGHNYLWHTDRGGGEPLFGWRTRYWNFLLKLAKDQPAWTLQAQPGPATGPFHWESRRLSRRELCRLQTFPDSIHVVGNVAAVQRQVGNAVPSLLAEVIARSMWSQLLGRTSKRGAPKLMPTRQDSVPAPEKRAPVPLEFLSMRGEHDPHPGTGRGNRARERWGVTTVA